MWEGKREDSDGRNAKGRDRPGVRGSFFWYNQERQEKGNPEKEKSATLRSPLFNFPFFVQREMGIENNSRGGEKTTPPLKKSLLGKEKRGEAGGWGGTLKQKKE